MLKKLLAALLALLAAAAFAAVDVNKASQAELEAVKGIGPAISTKILDARKKASFKDWNDMIERVNGIGENNAAKFSAAGLTVNGAAFSGAAKKDAAKGKATTAAVTPGASAAGASPAKPVVTAGNKVQSKTAKVEAPSAGASAASKKK